MQRPDLLFTNPGKRFRISMLTMRFHGGYRALLSADVISASVTLQNLIRPAGTGAGGRRPVT
jgi:hypothetical protein